MQKYKTYLIRLKRGKYGLPIMVDVPEDTTLNQVTQLVERPIEDIIEFGDLRKLTNSEYQKSKFLKEHTHESISDIDISNYVSSKRSEFFDFMESINSKWLASQFGLNKNEYRHKTITSFTFKKSGNSFTMIKEVEFE